MRVPNWIGFGCSTSTAVFVTFAVDEQLVELWWITCMPKDSNLMWMNISSCVCGEHEVSWFLVPMHPFTERMYAYTYVTYSIGCIYSMRVCQSIVSYIGLVISPFPFKGLLSALKCSFEMLFLIYSRLAHSRCLYNRVRMCRLSSMEW